MKKNLLFLFGIICFCFVTISGFILLLKFQYFRNGMYHVMDKHYWSVVHVWSSVGFLLFLLIHLFIQRKWIIENIINSKFKDLNHKVKSLCRNNIVCFVLYFLVASTGALICVIHGNCLVYKELHYKLALVLIFFLIIHLARHKYPLKRYFKSMRH